jgi:hypothetical protein
MAVSKTAPFDYRSVPKSTTIHLDFTGPLPEVGSNVTRMFMISSWGRYIHIQPLTNLRDEATTTALKEAILFWRSKGIAIDSVRMDKQCSIVSTLLYYCPVDPSICTAVHQLGLVQSKPSKNNMIKMEKLLQYVSKHRNIRFHFYASNMILQLMSDAPHLCSPRALSVVGFLAYLGLENAINRPISCNSKLINCVVASVAEAGLAGGFQVAQLAVHSVGYYTT